MTNEYLTSREAADLLGVTIQWVVKLIKARELDGEKRGRDWWISRRSVLDYKERREGRGGGEDG